MQQVSPKVSDERATQIGAMRRSDLVKVLRGMRCPFNLDFTDEFLDSVSVERLRHIVLGACLHECGG